MTAPIRFRSKLVASIPQPGPSPAATSCCTISERARSTALWSVGAFAGRPLPGQVSALHPKFWLRRAIEARKGFDFVIVIFQEPRLVLFRAICCLPELNRHAFQFGELGMKKRQDPSGHATVLRVPLLSVLLHRSHSCSSLPRQQRAGDSEETRQHGNNSRAALLIIIIYKLQAHRDMKP